MYMKWRRQIRGYIDAKVRRAMEWLYSVGVSTIKVGYPKNIVHENGNFDNNNNHVWTYGYLLKGDFGGCRGIWYRRGLRG
jgi:putative transposase